ncbi:MAG: amidohydrolase family protein [Candidatus Aminicenantes bacterium]|nr:amidohydrolase family protein [Candidatus Aminicenantes bacterium]
MITLDTDDLVRYLVRGQADQAGGTSFSDTTGSGTVPNSAASEREREGGRLFRIDAQSHMVPPPVLEFMMGRDTLPRAYEQEGAYYTLTGEWRRRVRPQHLDVDAKIADMDRAGIRTAALSINDPGPECFGADGPKVARLAHDFIGDAAESYPGRFFGLATLPLHHMEESLRELDRCVDQLGFRGILLYSNLAGRFPDEEEFRPLFKRAEEMGIPILLHPAYPMTYDAVKGHSLVGGLGLMFDTTIALARIILAGILDRHPRLKLLCPHVGGALPYLIGRMDHQTQVLKRGAENINRPPSEYLRQIYLDTVSPIAMAIRYGYDFAGPDRLLYASDHPWVDPNLIVLKIDSLGLPAADLKKIYASNAKKLFQL